MFTGDNGKYRALSSVILDTSQFVEGDKLIYCRDGHIETSTLQTITVVISVVLDNRITG